MTTRSNSKDNRYSKRQSETPQAEQTITVHVINDNGCLCSVSDITGDMKISDLMKKSFLVLYENESKSVCMYKIICIRTDKLLRHFHTVEHYKLVNGDELLLVERYVTLEENMEEAASSEPETELPIVINKATIAEMTKKLKVKNKKKKYVGYNPLYCNQFLIQRELNYVLVALIERSAEIVRFNNANDVFKEIVQKLKLDIKPNNEAVQALVDMGYSEDVSNVALTLKKNNLKEAVEWLVTKSSSVTIEDIAEFNNLDLNFDTVEITGDNFTELVMGITKYLMKKEQLDLDITERYLVKIKKMGFDENQVRSALRKASNEPNHACLLLTGEPGKSKTIDKEDTTALIVEKIISDPEVLVALSDRNMLIALLYLIDSPDNLVPWPVGSKIETLLMKMVQVFETEKYYLHGCRDIFPEPTIAIIAFADDI